MEIPALESASRALEKSLDFWGVLLLLSTAIVVIGLFFEYWEPVASFFGEWHRPAAAFPSGKFWELFGGLLVTVGVAGELWFTYQASRVETDLRNNNHQIEALLTKEAGDAKTSAEKAADASSRASSSAQEATSSSSSALTIAGSARREADSFEKDIVSAKSQAAEAESHLADALQRAAAAEAELNRLKTPRSLIHTDELIADLRPFKGTEYTLNTFQDEESIQFMGTINGALVAAGWVRKQPEWVSITMPTLMIGFVQGVRENVPVCVDMGVAIRARSKDSPEALNRIPNRFRPRAIQAALALESSLALRISPPDERNVVKGVLESDPMEGDPVTICVGKKP